MENRVKICWLGKKYQKKYVCFIPLTIDGMGKTVGDALANLESESTKIIKAIKRSHIQCNMSEFMIRQSIEKEINRWKNGKGNKIAEKGIGKRGRPRKTEMLSQGDRT